MSTRRSFPPAPSWGPTRVGGRPARRRSDRSRGSASANFVELPSGYAAPGKPCRVGSWVNLWVRSKSSQKHQWRQSNLAENCSAAVGTVAASSHFGVGFLRGGRVAAALASSAYSSKRTWRTASRLRELSPFRSTSVGPAILHLLLSQSASRGDRRERRTAQDTAARHFAKFPPQRIAHLRRSSDESSERGLLGIREGVGLIEREVHVTIGDAQV
jgi:hypothetical protein